MGEIRKHLSMRIATLLLLLCTAVIAPAQPTVAPTVALEDTLVVGVFPRRPVLQTQAMFTPLVNELGRALNRPVRLEVAADFTAFWQAIRSNRYHLTHYNPYHYVRAHREFGHQLVAMNEEFGSNHIRGAIWVRKDSGIRSADDLRRTKVAFGGGRKAMVSYIIATDLLQQAGLAPADYSSQFTITPIHALKAVYYRQSAAAGLNVDAFQQPRLSASMDGDQLTPLLVSEPVALHPWAVNARVDENLRQQISGALLGLKDTAQGRQSLTDAELTALVPADDTDYDPHRRIIARVLGEKY